MANKDAAKGIEAAEVTALDPVEFPEGMRMLAEHHKMEDKMPSFPKGKSGTWEEVQVADDPDAHYDHEQVWVEHYDKGNGRYMKGRLFKFVEAAE